MRYLRYLPLLLTLGCSIFAGWQSYMIASVGANQQIPQLEGNGGGGLLFAALCFLAGAFSVAKPKIAIALYMLSLAFVTLVSLTYQDDTMRWWAIGTLVLTLIHVACWQMVKRRNSSLSKAAANRKSTVHSQA